MRVFEYLNWKFVFKFFTIHVNLICSYISKIELKNKYNIYIFDMSNFQRRGDLLGDLSRSLKFGSRVGEQKVHLLSFQLSLLYYVSLFYEL